LCERFTTSTLEKFEDLSSTAKKKKKKTGRQGLNKIYTSGHQMDSKYFLTKGHIRGPGDL